MKFHKLPKYIAPALRFHKIVTYNMLLFGVGVTQVAACPTAFISTWSGNGVLALDTATNTITKTIPTTSVAGQGAVSPLGTVAYVTLPNSNSVIVIDAKSKTIIATIPVGSYPIGVTFSPDGNFAWVSNWGSGTVSVINANTRNVIKTIRVGSNPHHLAFTVDGKKAYVANKGSNNVSVIDTSLYSVTKTVAVGRGPVWVELNPIGDLAFVANADSNDVYIINSVTDVIAKNFSSGGTYTRSIVFNAEGTKLFVVHNTSSNVTVFDALTYSKLAQIPVAGQMNEIRATPYAKFAYVGATGSGVSVIDMNTNSVAGTIAAGKSLNLLALPRFSAGNARTSVCY